MRYELGIALRYLRARRKTAFISITTLFTAIGVTIGVAALIIVLSVMNGFEASLRQRLLSLSPQIQVLSSQGSITDYRSIVALVSKVPGVAGADPFVVGQALASSGRGVSGVIVRGVEVDGASAGTQLRKYVTQGSLSALNDTADQGGAASKPAGVAVGTTLGEKLRAKDGDLMKLVAPVMTGNGAEIATTTGDFAVAAIFESGVAFIDRNVVFISLARAQSFFGRVGRVDGIELRLNDLGATAKVTSDLRRLLKPPYRVRNWMEFNEAASAGFAMLKRVYALVMLLLIAVAAFNLVATLIMVVMERRKDVAVLMTMGATPRAIRQIFVLQGLVVGALGTAGGLILGGLGCFLLANYHFIHLQAEVYGMSTVPIEVSPLSFVAVAVASIALCLLATFYPARQAARQLPVEVLRS